MSWHVPLTAEGIAMGLHSGCLDILSEEWRRRLLASGMKERQRQVRKMASDVARARELCVDAQSPTSKEFVAAKVGLFLFGVASVVYGALARGEKRAVFCICGAVILLGVAVLVRVDYRRWWAQVVDTLFQSVHLPPV